MLFLKIVIFIFVCVANHAVNSVTVVSDDTLISIIQENKDLVILFAKKGCIEDCKYEKSVISIQDEIERTFSGSKVVKVENSQLVRLYNPIKKEPALVFLRNGVPIIYPENDLDNADAIFEFFNDNRDPIVKELDDSNFEHLTQASTGSTTGNWLIVFYDNSCVECTRLGAMLEAVGAKLKFSYTNVARVNIGTKGTQTAKRFKVEKVPTFILIRKGKFYRYNLMKYDIESFFGFATKTFQNFGAETIKAQASPFENLIDSIVEKLREMPRLNEMALSFFNEYPVPISIVASLIVLYIFAKLFLKGGKAEKEQSGDKKPKTKTTSKKEK